MSNPPTADQFGRLSKAGQTLRSSLGERLREKFLTFKDAQPTEAEILDLVSFSVISFDEETEAALGADGIFCLAWLDSEPAFKLAIKTLGYSQSDWGSWGGIFEDYIRRSFKHNYLPGYVASRIATHGSRYLRNISSIAGALSRYLSGARHREVIDGPSTIQRMKELLLEFEQLVAVDWMPEDLKEQLKYKVRTRSAIKLLDEPYILESPTSRRNDADLPTRLLASELLRINYSHQKSFHKKAVFHLLGLSFVERPLEMRTIERLAKSEMDALRECWAKKIADRKGLDFDFVLTTLKTNKSLTLPHEMDL
ncbi:hypothetical protein PMI22_00496 [Pseudomonas sp. GM21]|uniref:hypothetical protein n=1 Tax=Pseudomonas sp. GM21 TaxID=1144325 RepID=UPI0002722EC8|nr:hypothetical protein [Pseudomonas sp. GM21]EJM25150.1 hypothetical protein PMI22_00496 [Pseudomonas sp. GM21]